ncbi:MAG TPA: hypoxanthine phosphoribosyltransferase [Syntrophorhabdales bacterium]|nr:hypoxanthine phosphoribosyltransferase [Syntrophorhabdales bacterium]
MNDVLKPLFTRQQIRKAVKRLGTAISRDYRGEEVICICILKGSFMFTSDLVREIKLPTIVDFIRVSSYGHGTSSKGEITITKDLEVDIAGKHVLIIEDIVDSGLTLKWLRDTLLDRNPKSLKIVCLLDKKARRKIDIACDYIGLAIDDGFVVGYGIDYAEKYRNLPDILIVEKS